MTLVVRQGVRELLSFLSDFCVFYVYSHGVKEYILKILDILDPTFKYFDRNKVLAPATMLEQLQFKEKGKSITDVVNKDEMGRTLIVDDQYAVIDAKNKSNLLLSKKFLKYAEKLATKQKREEFNSFQFPLPLSKEFNSQFYPVHGEFGSLSA